VADDAPKPPTPPASDRGRRGPAETPLHRIIARRKFVDVVFSVLGAFLITASLAVLGLLVSDLVADGAGRIAETTETKEHDQSPGRGDILGTMTRGGAGAGAATDAWVLVRDPMPADLSKAKFTGEGTLDALDGRRVVVSATVPAPGKALEVEKIRLAPTGAAGEAAPRIGRRDTVGVLRKTEAGGDGGEPGGAGWVLSPDTLTLDVSELRTDLEPLEGKRVAVAGARDVAKSTVAVTEVSRMVRKTFFNSMPSRKAERAGIFSAWVGTCLVMLVTVCTALPLGVAAGVYLEEYAAKNWFTALIEINIANLAGVPSIIWGLMALGLFVYKFDLGHSILTAGLTLGLLVLPIVIIATREAIRAVPGGIRDASFALGATKWETVRHHVLPYSLGGILTGTIVSLSRAIGETAPLITIGALTYVAFLPDSPVTSDAPYVSFAWLKAPFTVLPIQMFNWISRPDRDFHRNAAGAGVILILMTLGMNAFAIFLRYRLRKRIQW
jgi:phosphate transport system permease protein